MSRPRKEGMDYFPHDTDAVNDEKIEALRLLYGNDGYAFYFILLERIYRTKQFELDVSDAETIQILSKKVGVNQEVFNQILETALKRGCFDRQAYEERQVLTSEGIRKRASVVIDKRDKMRSKYQEIKGIVSESETTQETKEETPQSKGKNKGKERIALKDYANQIKNLLQRYNQTFSELNKAYWNAIRETRSTKKIQQSVIAKTMSKWSEHPVEVVEYALKRHIEIGSTDKDEKYTLGIMRKTTKEEAIDKLSRMLPKQRGEKTDAKNQYSNLF